MQVKEYKNNKQINKDVSPLYVSAFPEEERPPVEIFYKALEKENNHLYAFYENEEFIGFSNLVTYKDIAYLFFLAVSPNKRNQGYGSKIIKKTLETFKDKTVFLCYEEIDQKYEDYSLRIRRRNFYYRNGFKDNELKSSEYGVTYDTCYHGVHKVKFDDYLNLLISIFGERVKKYVKKV